MHVFEMLLENQIRKAAHSLGGVLAERFGLMMSTARRTNESNRIILAVSTIVLLAIPAPVLAQAGGGKTHWRNPAAERRQTSEPRAAESGTVFLPDFNAAKEAGATTNAKGAKSLRTTIVGSWKYRVTPLSCEECDPFDGAISFSSDGVSVTTEANPLVTDGEDRFLDSPGHGTWAVTGSANRTFATTFVVYSSDPVTGELFATCTITATLQLASDGKSFTGQSRARIIAADGTDLGVDDFQMDGTKVALVLNP